MTDIETSLAFREVRITVKVRGQYRSRPGSYEVTVRVVGQEPAATYLSRSVNEATQIKLYYLGVIAGLEVAMVQHPDGLVIETPWSPLTKLGPQLHQRRARGWPLAAGEGHLAHIDLLEKIVELIGEISTEWVWLQR